LWEECQTSENKTQTRWLEERKIYYTSGPAPWISPKMAPALQLKAEGFLMPQNAEASKQEGQQ
jgi:hypothetical protein